ncbi:MAG: tetratricopeptide repeat protein [Armatimonadota bacterium]
MECALCGVVVPGGQTSCPYCGTPITEQHKIPKDDEAHRLLAEANLLRLREQHDEAIGICTRVLRMDHNNAAAHSLLGDIYREQGDDREALGWYKLAVSLDPANQIERRKLDDMIDRVFKGAGKEEQQAVPHLSAAAHQKPAAQPRRRTTLKELLEKLQPVHVVIACSVVAMVTMIIFLLVMSRPKPSAQAQGNSSDTTPTEMIPLPANDSSAGSALTTTTNPNTVMPQVIAPGPDAVENPPYAIPGLSGIVMKPRGEDNAKPATGPAELPHAAPPMVSGTAPSNQLPPFMPNNENPTATMTSGETSRQTESLKAALARNSQQLKLQPTLSEVSIDPRGYATIQFTIPPLNGAQQVKLGLLYTGFYLAWSAYEQNKSLRSINIRGYAYSGAGTQPTLAFIGDISPQQAQNSRGAREYRALLDYLTEPWWRSDLANAQL